MDESIEGKTWLDEYARGFVWSRKHYPEHTTDRGNAALKRIWDRLRPKVVERFPDDDVPEDVPKDIAKWAILPDVLELMEANPHVHKNVFNWLDDTIPTEGLSLRGGASTIRRLPDHQEARSRQGGTGVNRPKPAWTFHGKRLPYTGALKFARTLVEKAVRAGIYPDLEFEGLDVASLDNWYHVQGGQCSTYVFFESGLLFQGMTPHQDSHAPIPHDVLQQAWEMKMEREFPNFLHKPLNLKPRHLFVGPRDAAGIYLGNRAGAAGYPYTNMSRPEIAAAIGKKSVDGVRITKDLVQQHAMRQLVAWIDAGMPMRGELYEAVSQPATLAFRGDREVHLDLRKWASIGPDSEYNSVAKQLAAILPSRSVIIVPTVLVLAQSTWAQPMGAYVNDVGTPGFDWVDPYHTTTRLDAIRRADLDQGDTRGPSASVGADASGWDRDITPQDHASETATYLSMFPDEVELLYVDAPMPVRVSDSFVDNILSRLGPGETMTGIELTGVDGEGGEHLVTGDMRAVRFNYHEFICKVMTMVNDAPVRWADYEIESQGIRVTTPAIGNGVQYEIVSNGGRRSGDAITGLANTDTNLVKSYASALMSRSPELAALIRRRCKYHDTPPPVQHVLVDDFARGDDRATVIALLEDGVPSEAIAGGLAAIGMRANAKKQEASDIPGKPVFAFANITVTTQYMGKHIGRYLKRFHVQESSGIPIEAQDALRDVGNTTGFADSLILTTMAALARLAGAHGFPLMSTHPLAEETTRYGIDNDRYRLTYLSEDSFDGTGKPTEAARIKSREAAEVAAKVQAKMAMRRANVSVDLDTLKEVWLGSSIHDFVEDVSFAEDYEPTYRREIVDNDALFQEAVEQGTPLNI